MSENELGFTGAVSIGLGGVIGGVVFAVLGVVASVAVAAAWRAFVAASLVSTCAAYSYIALNRIGDTHGGSVTQIEAFRDDQDLAGTVGWTLLFGYIGAIAMHAFALGGFAFRRRDHDEVVGAIPTVGTVGVVGLFPPLVYHLSTGQRGVSWSVLLIAALVVTAELLYFNREAMVEGARTLELAVEAEVPVGNGSDH